MSGTGADPVALAAQLAAQGYAAAGRLLSDDDCAALRAGFGAADGYRSTVDMARHGYGSGRYRYFAYPLPPLIAGLRTRLYPPLAAIANEWAALCGEAESWPADHAALITACHAAGQTRPTPLVLRYGPGDHNRLHQDLYGAVAFPLQLIVALSPAAQYGGGELVLVETWPRRQSRCQVVPMALGEGVIIPVRTRPVPSARGWRRIAVRHGVSIVTRGERMTLGIIFHDAA